MSEFSSSGTEKTGPSKTPTSPARNIIGLIVLIGVIVFGVYEYSAKSGFNKAVAALNARAEDENQALLTVAEAENLLGKAPDGPATEFKEGQWHFTTKTYTWPGLLKRYTLTAYYTTEKDSRLHHYETEGKKFELRQAPEDTTSTRRPSTKSASKEQSGKASGTPVTPKSDPTAAADSKSQPAVPVKDASTAKPQPPVNPAPGGQPAAEPADKGSPSKTTTTPVPAKPTQ